MKILRAFIAFLILSCGLPAHAASTVRVDVDAGPGREQAPQLLGMGGNIWRAPQVFEAGVSDMILKADRLGMTRLSLGDLVLEGAQSPADLKARLQKLPLNDFLKRYTAAGGKILFILDGVPRYMSSTQSEKIHAGPDQPLFRISPPRDFEQWSEVVEMLVRHFNGQLGMDAYYEVWNEPNFYYQGRTEEFLKQYYHTVLGARRADPRARVGGPCISEFLSVGTAGDVKVEKKELLTRLLKQKFLFRQFLDYAAATPVPELGLKRLPVDFFSWHSFYIDPSTYYTAVVPAFREALTATGYPANTPMINTEWNIAAVPPYPEGDLNSTEVGAAFVASSLIAMHEADVDGQIFQMYVDPGTKGYHGGMFTNYGVPRANYQAFRLLAMLKGTQLKTSSSDPWVKSIAFKDGKTTYLLLSTFVPTPQMISNTQKIRNTIDNAEVSQAMARQGLEDEILAGKPLPDAVTRQAKQTTDRNVKIGKDDLAKAERWKSAGNVDIEINLKSAPGKVRHFLIDANHSNVHKDLRRAQEHLAKLADKRDSPEAIEQRLKAGGVNEEAREKIMSRLRKKQSVDDALASMPPAQRAKAEEVLRQAVQQVRQNHMKALQEISNWPSAKLYEKNLDWPANGTLRLDSEPYAVHLFVFND